MRMTVTRTLLLALAMILLGLAGPALAEQHAHLKVRNHTHDVAQVYCDGEFLGTVQPGQTRTFSCDSGDIVVRAQGEDGSWGPREFHVHEGNTQTWTLVDSEGDSHTEGGH